MSFNDCILDQLKVLPPQKAQELLAAYDDIVERYTIHIGQDAARKAAADFVAVQKSIILKEIKNKVAFAKALPKIRSDIEANIRRFEAYKQGGSRGTRWAHGDSATRAVLKKLDEAYIHASSLAKIYEVRMGNFIEQYRSKVGGFKQDSAGMLDAIRESAGISTGNDVAKALGQSLKKVMDEAHRAYSASGGIIGKLEDWVAPHVHNAELMKKVTADEWIAKLMPLLDRKRMINNKTGMPFSDKDLIKVMRSDYEGIITHGLNDIAEKAKQGKQIFGRGGGPAKRRIESRFYHFKSVDDFLEYNRSFGVGDHGLFDAYMMHIRKIARDTAIMQVLSPNPAGVMANLELELISRGKGKNFVRGAYNVLVGGVDSYGQISSMYKFFNGWLHIKRAAYLGGAPISAMSDSFYGIAAAKLNGLDSTKVMGRYLSLLRPDNFRDRDIARRSFHITSAASGSALEAIRHSDSLGHSGIPSKLSGAVHRLSGLATMTDAMRQAFHMEAAGLFNDFKANGAKWNDIDKTLRESLEAEGMTEKDFNEILKAEVFVEPQTGASYLRPEDVAESGAVDAAVKMQNWLTSVANLAVNEPGLVTRTITTGAWTGADAKHGTLLRLLSSNSFFAKSFGITVLMNHTIPAIRESGHGRMGRLLATAFFTTVLGGAAMQVRNIAFGKDPQDMTTPKFWVSAMLQGGGLGVFGDFLFADTSRTGNTFAEMLAGPIPMTAWNIAKAGDLYSLGTEVDMDSVVSDLFRIGNKEIPLARIWYSRMVVERMFLDQVEKALDPSYEDRIRRVEKRMKKQRGQEFWWRPGDVSPKRSPDLGTAAGE